MNNKPKKENKMLLLVGIISLLVLVFSIVVNADNGCKDIKTPILDQSVVPGFHLGHSELDKSWEKNKDNVKAKFLIESWNSLPREEITRLRKERNRKIRELREKGVKDENIEKHLRISPYYKIKHITIRIVIFKSRKKASKWAVPYLKSRYAAYNPILKEGTLCGKKIGDKCWVSGGKQSLSVDFLKDNFLVELNFVDPEGIDESFALRVAKNIAEKL